MHKSYWYISLPSLILPASCANVNETMVSDITSRYEIFGNCSEKNNSCNYSIIYELSKKNDTTPKICKKCCQIKRKQIPFTTCPKKRTQRFNTEVHNCHCNLAAWRQKWVPGNAMDSHCDAGTVTDKETIKTNSTRQRKEGYKKNFFFCRSRPV